jgi:hypothetical protein
MNEQTLSEIAEGVGQGVNVFEEIGKLYCQVEAQKRALNLAIVTIKALQPKDPEAPVAAPGDDDPVPEHEPHP